MTTYSVRCRVDRCRHRRVTKVHPDESKRRHRCPKCGSLNGWRIENRDYNKRNLCYCAAVEAVRGVRFPHRVHNPYCEQNAWSEFNRARYAGIPGGYLIGWRAERRPATATTERRSRPAISWQFELSLGRRMSPDEPCPF